MYYQVKIHNKHRTVNGVKLFLNSYSQFHTPLFSKLKLQVYFKMNISWLICSEMQFREWYMMQFQRKIHPIFHRHSEIALKNILYVVQYMNQPTDNVLPINNWVIVCTVGDLTYFVFKNIVWRIIYSVMVMWAVKFLREGYKTREIFGQKLDIYLLLN